jgi:hypothetical protein
VIYPGDITDGIEAFGQVEAAHAILARLAVQLFHIPDDDHTDAAMQTRFRAMFDADHWRHEADGWTVIGLNARLFGTGGRTETAQSTWLGQTLRDISGPIGVFLHQPWFHDGIDGAERRGGCAQIEARQKAARAFAGQDLRFIASGHSHQLRAVAGKGVARYWAPTAVAATDRMRNRNATKSVGFDTLTLTIDERSFHHVEAPGHRQRDRADESGKSRGMPSAMAEAL